MISTFFFYVRSEQEMAGKVRCFNKETAFRARGPSHHATWIKQLNEYKLKSTHGHCLNGK